MKRKAVTLTIVIVVVVLVIGLVVPLLLDAERFRPTIERRLSATLGRQVHIGALRFSWLAGGISAREVAIGEDPAFGSQPFLTAKALDVSVEMWPLLLHRELQINSVKVREPEVRLIERDTRWNVSSLGRGSVTSTQSAPTQATPEATAVQLKKLAIEDGRFVVQSGGATQTYSNVNVNATNVAANAPIPLTVAAKTPGNGSFNLEGTVGPLSGGAFPAQFNVKLDHLDLASSGYFGPNATVGGVADAKVALKASGIGGRNGRVHAEGNVMANKFRLVKNGAAAPHPISVDFASDYDLAPETGRVTRGDLKFNKTLAHLTGSFDLHGAAPLVNMTLSAPGMLATDIQDLLPPMGLALPGGASLQGGTASTSLTMTGPADRMTVNGPLRMADVTISGFDLGSKMKGIGSLAGINTGRDTNIQSLAAQMNATPEAISLNDINLAVQGIGTLTGNGSVATVDRRLNFQLVAHLNQRGGVLGGLLESAKVGQLSNVPFRVEGTSNDPRFVPDVNAILNTGNRQTSTQPQPKTPLGGLFQQLLNKKK